MKKQYLKATHNSVSDIYEIELFDENDVVVRSYAEVPRKEDADFICSSFTSKESVDQLAENAHLLHIALKEIADQFRSFGTSYTQYQTLIKNAKELLTKVTL